MERLTHERVNGIKTGYWSAATIEKAAKSSETKTATVMAECIAGALKDTLEKYGTAGDKEKGATT
jgi:hypothetical protein